MPFAVHAKAKKSNSGFRTRAATSPEAIVKRALSLKKVSIPLLRRAVLEREHQIHREHPHMNKVLVLQKASNDVMRLIEKQVKK